LRTNRQAHVSQCAISWRFLEHSEKLKDSISSGEVDDTKAVGLIDQWLIEGKFTEEEALSQSYDMLSAGIDTVRTLLLGA